MSAGGLSGPSDQEMAAAVVVVLAALAGRAASAEPAGPGADVTSLWRDRTALVRAPLRTGAGAWRGSGLPR